MNARASIVVAVLAAAFAVVAFVLLRGRGDDAELGTPAPDQIERTGGAEPRGPDTPDPETRSADSGTRQEVRGDPVRTELPSGAELQQGFVGRVLDSRRFPVDRASVFLVEARQHDIFATLLMRQRGMVVPPVAKTETAEDGSFRLGVRNVAAGGYEIHILSDRHADHVVLNLTAFAGRFVEVGEVELPRGLALTGTVTVLGSAGFPVPGAEIVVRPAGLVPSLAAPPGREDGISTTADSNGSFRLDNIAAGFVSVTAVAPGFARVERQAIEIRPEIENRVDFELPKGMSIAGTVRTEDGQGIEGARVDAALLSSRQPFGASARTDADGHFEVLGLVEGPYALTAVAGGFVNDERKPVRSGSMNEMFTLPRQGSIAVRVVGDGRPLSRFDVLLRSYDSKLDALRPVLTAQIERVLGDGLREDGRFRLRDIDPGTYVIQVDAPRFARTFSLPCSVELGASEVLVDVEMLAGGTLVGRCVGPDGLPVSGVKVRTLPGFFDASPLINLIGDAIPHRLTTTTTTSGANGLFGLPRLAPGDYQLRLDHPALAPQGLRDIRVTDRERVDLGDLRMLRGAELRGTVVLDGAPAGQVKVSASSIPDPEAAGRAMFRATAVTDDRGRFVFDRRLPPGRYQIQAARQTLPNPILQVVDYQKTRQEFAISAGQESHQMHFTLTSG